MPHYGLSNRPDSSLKAPDVFAAIQAKDYTMADYSYEIIMDRIRDFEADLDEEHEVAVCLAAFGQSITMAVTSVGYSNPSTLVFHGFVNGQRATLVQHMTQLNFLLLAVKKQDPAKPPRRIGFERTNED